jgi:hypothetical protein
MVLAVSLDNVKGAPETLLYLPHAPQPVKEQHMKRTAIILVSSMALAMTGCGWLYNTTKAHPTPRTAPPVQQQVASNK